MDPKHTGDVVKHLEKENELLMDAYRSMSHELHRLQVEPFIFQSFEKLRINLNVEEEMLMRKYYEFMAAQDLVGKKTSADVRVDEETTDAGDGAMVVVSREEQS